MALVNEKVHQMNGMKVHTVKTDKFKTVTMVMQFRAPLDSDTVTKRALLANVLKSSTQNSPTSQDLQKRLDELYGASFSGQVQKKGNDHVLSLFVHTANERFIAGTSSLLNECVRLVSEAILKPNVKNEAFDDATFKKEQRSLKQRLIAIYDDKMRYANERLVDEMCRGEAYALHTNGTVDDLEKIDPGSLYKYFTQMLTEDEIDIFVVGDIDHDEIADLIQKEFAELGRTHTVQHPFVFKPVTVKEPNVVKESQDVEQGKLNLGYRTNIVVGDPLYYASQVFNGLFGGFPHSKLFMNVREKASLAYYAASRYESYKGLLMVMSGIEFENYEQATTIISEQLQAMQSGDYSESDVAQTKALLKNAMLEALDSPFALVDTLYRKVLFKESGTLEEWFEGIEKVTKDDMIEVAKRTQLDTIYFLQGQEG